MGARGRVHDAVQNVAPDLMDWSRNVLGDLEKRIKWTRKALENCRRGPMNGVTVGRMDLLKSKLDRLEEKNIYWRQRAKVHWLERGDRNTKFFHQYASDRKRRSQVRRIVLDDGRVVEEGEDMKGVITNFYKDLFSSSAGANTNDLLQHVATKVTPAMNLELLKEFSDEEIKDGLNGIGNPEGSRL
jgi:hypothetical protein